MLSILNKFYVSKDFLLPSSQQINKMGIANNAKILFTLDSTVNDNLRVLFKGYENKTFALNHFDPFLSTEDPFRFNEDKYLAIMSSIQKICSKLHDSIYNELL